MRRKIGKMNINKIDTETSLLKDLDTNNIIFKLTLFNKYTLSYQSQYIQKRIS